MIESSYVFTPAHVMLIRICKHKQCLGGEVMPQSIHKHNLLTLSSMAVS